MRRAARIDRNQNEIVKALRKAGCSVQILSAVGQGCVDILAGLAGVNYLLEIKDGEASPSLRRLTEDEQRWHDGWKGSAKIVESVDEALRAVNL